MVLNGSEKTFSVNFPNIYLRRMVFSLDLAFVDNADSILLRVKNLNRDSGIKIALIILSNANRRMPNSMPSTFGKEV
jgi:uncharacterized membrane protein YfhO